MMIIAIERTDDGVSLMHLVDGQDASVEVDKWKALFPGLYKSHGEIASTPGDRDSRDKWKVVNGKISRPAPSVKLTEGQRLANTLINDELALTALAAAITKGGGPKK